MAPPLAAHAKKYGDWQTAAPVTGLNSAATEGCPIEAPDGEHVYLMSTRGPGGDQDIWVATRSATGEVGEPQMLPEPVNSDANDFCPTPLRGGALLFVSTRGGVDAYGTTACGGGDIYRTRQSPATGEWLPPRNLGCAAQGGPNGATRNITLYIVQSFNDLAPRLGPGYGSAVAMILFAIILVLTLIQFRVLGRRVHYN